MTSTLLIGMDGATFTVLDGLTTEHPDEGVVMPFLAEMINKGYSAKLRSTNHPLTPPAWTTVFTGRTPGNHGVYDFVRYEDMGDELYFTLYDARDIRTETLWQIASRQERSVVSLNFPMTAPPPEINGSLVPGFVSWKHLKRNMWPTTLFDRINSIEGFDAREMSWDFERESQIGELMPDSELLAWVQTHLPRDEQWFNIGMYLLQEDKPDLFALMFDGTDKIQHQAWHVLDPELWNGEASEDARSVRKLVLQYFRNLDEYLRRIHAAAGGEDCHMVIVSDHGFAASDKVVRINAYLAELGLLYWRESDGSEAAKKRDLSDFANLDWEKTLAFSPTPSSNGIVIRQQSEKNPNGVPADEYEAFRDKLIADLFALRDPDTGEAVISEVMKREDAFPGPAMKDAPDLTLVLSDYGFVSIRNKTPFVVTRPTPFGTHHPDGVFLMSGPGVRNLRGETMSIANTATIVSHVMGMEVPEDFEGVIPDTLFEPAWLEENPVKIGPPTLPMDSEMGITAKGGDDREATDEEREEVLEQLRLLGYLEDD